MLYKFNQSKRFQRSEKFCAFSDAFLIALLSVTLLYAITDLVLIETASDIDFISNIFYSLIFIFIFIAVLSVRLIMYSKIRKGVEIGREELTYSVGYYSKGIPVTFPKIYGKIKLSDIKSVEYMEHYKWSELRKDYRNYNYSWIFIGGSSRNYPVAKVTAEENGFVHIYMFPLDDINSFISELTTTCNM